VLAQQITKDAASVSSVARGVPRQLAEAIDRCLVKDSNRRFASGSELADALAPTLAVRSDIPAPLRVFIERRRMAALIGPPAMSLMLALGTIADGSQSAVLIAGMILGIGVVLPISVLLYRLRNLARIGYGPSDVASALRRNFERRREEFFYDFGPAKSLRERVLRIAAYALGLLAVGIGTQMYLTAGDLPPAGRITYSFPPIVVLGIWAMVLGGITQKWNRIRDNKDPAVARFWDGRLG
jgi:hypothetical protein